MSILTMSKGKVKVSEDTLQLYLPNIKRHLTHCPDCSQSAEYLDHPAIHPWATRLVCSCRRDWLVCNICSTQRKPLVFPKQISKHAVICQELVQQESSVSSHLPPGPNPFQGGNKSDCNLECFNGEDDTSVFIAEEEGLYSWEGRLLR